jgi:bifunctional non-homologous end joining protein LigD
MPRSRSGSASPQFITPMKALGVPGLPPDDAWHGEIKFDGYRAIAIHDGSTAALWSRNRKPLDYPSLLAALAKLRCTSAVLDGEIVALDAKGNSRFQLLQNHAEGGGAVVYYVFDLLQLNGRSLLDMPIEQRRKLLEKFIGKAKGAVRLSPMFAVPPAKLLAVAKASGLEGIILKRRESLYEAGQRSGAWLKVKNINEQEFVIGGFTPPQHSRQSFGALLVGYYQGGKLRYAGKVGSGFNGALLRSLHARLLAKARQTCPFCDLPLERKSRFGTGMPLSEMAKVTWVKPDLVAQVKFTEWTNDGLLRQPVFLGLRKDKPAKQVRREAGAV